MCVLAGAGAGKTRVLTLRVARRVGDGSADPAHVLVATFSRKAADELRRRLWMLGVAEAITAGTFHRSALALLRQHRSDQGRPAPTVMGDRRSELRTVVREWSADAPVQPDRGTVAQLDTEIGWAKARMVAPAGYEAAARVHGRRSSLSPAAVAELYRRYEAVRERAGRPRSRRPAVGDRRPARTRPELCRCRAVAIPARVRR